MTDVENAPQPQGLQLPTFGSKIGLQDASFLFLLGDDDDWQWKRQVIMNIPDGLIFHCVQQLVSDGDESWSQPGH